MEYLVEFSAFSNTEYMMNGETPKLFYHSSDNVFNNFKSPEDEGYQRKHSLTNKGIYFHESKPLYAYGKHQYEVFLRIKNPFVIDNRTYISDIINPYTNKKIEVEHINSEDIKFLKENGYDAVMCKYPAYQTVVFDSDQCKIIKRDGKLI